MAQEQQLKKLNAGRDVGVEFYLNHKKDIHSQREDERMTGPSTRKEHSIQPVSWHKNNNEEVQCRCLTPQLDESCSLSRGEIVAPQRFEKGMVRAVRLQER